MYAGDIGRAPSRSSSDGCNVLDVPVRGSSQHDHLEATVAISASLSPAAAAAAADADAGALVIGVSDESGYAGADGSQESSLAAEESSFSAKEGSFSAAGEQGFSAGAEEKRHTINAGIYGDSDGEDDGFGSSPGLNTAGPVDGAAGGRVAAGAAAFSKGGGGKKRRRGGARGESSTDDVTGSASASSPWCTNTSGELWSDGDPASEDEDECQEGAFCSVRGSVDNLCKAILFRFFFSFFLFRLSLFANMRGFSRPIKETTMRRGG